jgi:hypothetical protein
MLYKALTLLVAGAAAGIAEEARAQAATATANLHVERLAHRLTLDTARLHPARLTYRTSLVKDSVSSFNGETQVVIGETQYAGAPAWLLTQSGMRGVAVASDSLVVSRADLRPLHWTAAQGVARLAIEFTRDTIFGVMSSPLGRQNIVLANRTDLLVNAASVDLVLAALPLDTGWKDSATVLVVDAGGSATTPVTLAVDGEEHASVPAGEYDCWVVSLESERGSARYWVSKDARLIVRSEQLLPQLGEAVLIRELAFAEIAPTPTPPTR